jgi:hypothetical protein
MAPRKITLGDQVRPQTLPRAPRIRKCLCDFANAAARGEGLAPPAHEERENQDVDEAGLALRRSGWTSGLRGTSGVLPCRCAARRTFWWEIAPVAGPRSRSQNPTGWSRTRALEDPGAGVRP